ncbi:MAG: hypothetical protein QGG14_08655 [Planctomycetota bacterium]|nr:hypothetical protein [Planctomycetota bacterium]
MFDARSGGVALALLLCSMGCTESAVSGVHHPAALLPDDCAVAVGWDRALDFEIPHGLELLRGAPQGVRESLCRDSGSFGGRLVKGQEEPDIVAPTERVGLGKVRWFREALAGLEVPGPGTTFAVDIRGFRKWPGTSKMLGQLPGVASFLSAALWVGPSGNGTRECRAFTRLARMPVGIAKIFNVEPAQLQLPRLLLPVADGASWLCVRADPSAVVNTLQAMIAGIGFGAFGPGPSEILRGLRGGFVFRREVWEAAGREAAIVIPEWGKAIVVISVRDRDTLLSVARETSGLSGRMRIVLDEDGPAPIARVDGFGRGVIAVLGRSFVAIGRVADEKVLLAILERERDERRPGLPFAAPELLNAVGQVRVSGQVVCFWTKRTATGLCARGTLQKH